MLLKNYFINSLIDEDYRGYCPVFRTNTIKVFYSIDLLWRAENPTSHEVFLFPHSCVLLTHFIWIHTSHTSFPL